jgi:hypothetical protein
MKVLALGLPRTGSTSLAEALRMLGYDGVHHTSRAAFDHPADWEVLDRAADATFSCLPTYTGRPFTRAEWDEIYGPYEACTDAASMFGPELIAAYPDAKVVLVERDYDRWFASVFGSLVPLVWGPMANFSLRYIEPLAGSRGGAATRKMILGLFGAATPDEALQKARWAYDRHGSRIRDALAGQPDRLLVYRMGDGWEPLCRFLGRPVPDADFPWLNEAAALRRIAMDITTRNAAKAGRRLLPWLVGLAAVGAGFWMSTKRH